MRDVSQAEKLLQSLGITEPQEIDLEAIAYDQNAFVKYRPLKDCEARIIGYDDKAIITVDDSRHPHRIRFSTAHELGHWHYHRGRSLLCRSEDIGNQKYSATHPERAADSFAADLLLPRYLFCPRAEALGKTNFESVENLAREFNTSITATSIRLVENAPEPAMLICHGPHGRKWFNRPRTIPERWFPKNELDPDSFSLDVLYGHQQRSRRALMDAETWFDRREAYEYEVYEESIKISNDEILTLLVFKDEEMLEDR